MGETIVVVATGPFLRRSSRTVRPSSKVSTVLDTFEKVVATTKSTHGRTPSVASGPPKADADEETSHQRRDPAAAKSGVQRMVELMKKTYEELRQLNGQVNTQGDTIKRQEKLIQELHQIVLSSQNEIRQVNEQFHINSV